ncbi:MAG: zf-HC2 domain-containing protein [Rhodothermales bacterium]
MTDHTEDLLNLYIDGELPLDQQGALFAHLAESREARVQFNALMAFRLATRMDANPVAPAVDEALFQRIDGLRAGQQQAVGRAEDRRPFRALRRRVTIGTTLALMALVLVIRALVPGPPPTETVRFISVEHVEPVYVMWPGVTVEDETLVGQ